MASRVMQLLLALLALCPLASHLVDAAPRGMSLGCFDAKKVRIIPAAKGVRVAAWACMAHCAKRQLPLFGIMCRAKCVCASEIPPAWGKSRKRSCGQRLTRGCTTVNLAYVNGDGKRRCQLAPVNFRSMKFPEGQSRVSIANSNSMTFSMVGSGTGARAETTDQHAYGLYQVRMKGAPGKAVAAFYLTSNTVIPPANNWDEIDFETINWRNGTDQQGMFWLNVFKDGQSVEGVEQSGDRAAKILGNPKYRHYDYFTTYTIDWQPTHIRWYLNGRLLHARNGGAIPSKPTTLILSLWARDYYGCWWWGGCVEGNHYATAGFSDLRRVICN